MLKGYGGDAYLLKHWDDPQKRDEFKSILFDGGGNSMNSTKQYITEGISSAELKQKNNKTIIDHVFLSHFHTDHYIGLQELLKSEAVHIHNLYLLKEMEIKTIELAYLDLRPWLSKTFSRFVMDIIDGVSDKTFDNDIAIEAADPRESLDNNDVSARRIEELVVLKLKWLAFMLKSKALDFAGQAAIASADSIRATRARLSGIISNYEKDMGMLPAVKSEKEFPIDADGFLPPDIDSVHLASSLACDLLLIGAARTTFTNAVNDAKTNNRLGCIHTLDFVENGLKTIFDGKNNILPYKGSKIISELPLRFLNVEGCVKIYKKSSVRHNCLSGFAAGGVFGADNKYSRVAYYNDNPNNMANYDGGLVKNEFLLLADSELQFWGNKLKDTRKMVLKAPQIYVTAPHHGSSQDIKHGAAYKIGKYDLANTGTMTFLRSDGRGSSRFSERPGKEFTVLKKTIGFNRLYSIDPNKTSRSLLLIKEPPPVYCMTCDYCKRGSKDGAIVPAKNNRRKRKIADNAIKCCKQSVFIKPYCIDGKKCGVGPFGISPNKRKRT